MKLWAEVRIIACLVFLALKRDNLETPSSTQVKSTRIQLQYLDEHEHTHGISIPNVPWTHISSNQSITATTLTFHAVYSFTPPAI
jgi:hypothetical protein